MTAGDKVRLFNISVPGPAASLTASIASPLIVPSGASN
jgi:hypothetical protein